jgi:hypothetical protein
LLVDQSGLTMLPLVLIALRVVAGAVEEVVADLETEDVEAEAVEEEVVVGLVIGVDEVDPEVAVV